MILHKVSFGTVTRSTSSQSKEVADDYLSVLAHNGQADSGFVFVTQDGCLCAYIALAGTQAHRRKYHCKYGRERLKRVVAWFDREPIWERLDDGASLRDTTWSGAPFLYLFTHLYDTESPLCRGDTGRPIPLYRLPGCHELRERVFFWQNSYRDHDSIWMKSGALELPAYKQLACPDSELSQHGRETCADIEEKTGVSTYYYLHRYYGRRDGEDRRRCPGCGRSWRTEHPLDDARTGWHEFGFKCDVCRLVSHLACITDEVRYAHVGEWRKARHK